MRSWEMTGLAIIRVKPYTRHTNINRYEMVNPGQDGDFTNDPTQNPDHALARRVDSRLAQMEELRATRSKGSPRRKSKRVSNGGASRGRQGSSSTAFTNGGDCVHGPNGCSMFTADVGTSHSGEGSEQQQYDRTRQADMV